MCAKHKHHQLPSHLFVVIASFSLLLTRKNTRCVTQRDALQHFTLTLSALKVIQKTSAELLKTSEGQLGTDAQCISRYHTFVIYVVRQYVVCVIEISYLYICISILHLQAT
jgi:hypothetical protein